MATFLHPELKEFPFVKDEQKKKRVFKEVKMWFLEEMQIVRERVASGFWALESSPDAAAATTSRDAAHTGNNVVDL
jgi:hypothetical protein